LRNRTLWDAIRAHPLPADAAGASFAEQLAREHKITGRTADRAIEEYRRFLYLSALGEGRSVPSRAVDAVWHLHLNHTRDYWGKLVPDVLGGRPIHHEPGSPDGHASDFRDTIRRYEREFGEAPPKGIWKARGGSPLGTAFTLLFLGVWGAIFIGGSLAIGLWPVGLIGAGFLALALRQVLAEAFPDATWTAQIDIWADGEGGDCGDCGGGCGD
jgi:hypothetical protein